MNWSFAKTRCKMQIFAGAWPELIAGLGDPKDRKFAVQAYF